MSFSDDVADSLKFAKHLPAYVHRVSFRRHRPLKLLLNCEIAKKVVFGPPICGGKVYPEITDMHFQTTLTSDHVAGYGLAPFGELGD